MNDDGRIIQLTEGRETKGGHNPPNLSDVRPPAPQGSGGIDLEYEAIKASNQLRKRCLDQLATILLDWDHDVPHTIHYQFDDLIRKSKELTGKA